MVELRTYLGCKLRDSLKGILMSHNPPREEAILDLFCRLDLEPEKVLSPTGGNTFHLCLGGNVGQQLSFAKWILDWRSGIPLGTRYVGHERQSLLDEMYQWAHVRSWLRGQPRTACFRGGYIRV
jgi:hypothetical protein